jgi:hypothetical protein
LYRCSKKQTLFGAEYSNQPVERTEKKGMKSSVRLTRYRILFGLLLFALMPALQAAPLNLVPTFPNFLVNMSGGSNIYAYDSGTNTLTIDGFVTSYTETEFGTEYSTITNNSFLLTATFGNLNNCPGPTCTADVTSGSFSLFGEVRDPDDGFNIFYDGYDGNGPGDPNGLLSGDLVDFGWSGTGNTTGELEFTFDHTSGILATGPLTKGGNPTGYSGGGMILDVNTTFDELGELPSPFSSSSTFNDSLLTTNWTGTGTGQVFVPVPAAVWLFGSGLIGLVGLGARDRKRLT